MGRCYLLFTENSHKCRSSPSLYFCPRNERVTLSSLIDQEEKTINRCVARKNKESHVASQQVRSARKVAREGGEIEKIPYLYLLAFGFTILTHRTRASSFAIDGIEVRSPVY